MSSLEADISKIDADDVLYLSPQLDIWSKSNYQVFQKVSSTLSFLLRSRKGNMNA